MEYPWRTQTNKEFGLIALGGFGPRGWRIRKYSAEKLGLMFIKDKNDTKR